MSEIVRLAQQFKSRNNPNLDMIQAMVGTVISVEPLQIGIYNNSVILTSELCYMCSNLTNYTKNSSFVLNTSTDLGTISCDGTISYKDIIKVGDNLMCIPTNNGQKYFIVDKII